MLNVRLLAVALLLAGSFTLIADEPAPGVAPRPAAKSRNKVYPVADLVIPVRNDVSYGECPATRATCEDQLIELITNKVQPHCWTKAGGPCVIEYFPIGMGLVVSGPDEVQAEVAAVLDSLRKSQQESIVVSIRFMTVSTEFLQQFGLDDDLHARDWRANDCCCDACDCWNFECDDPDCCCGGCRCLEPDCCHSQTSAVALTPLQIDLLLAAIDADRSARISQAPRVMMGDGESASLDMRQQVEFVTGVKVESVDGQIRTTAQMTPMTTGMRATVKGAVSADQRYVAVHLATSHSYLKNDEVPMCPIAVGQPGSSRDLDSQRELVPGLAIQMPTLGTLSLETDLNIRAGATMLVYGGQIQHTARVERAIPLLGKLPGLGRLFKHTSNETTTEHLLVMVTPEIIHGLPSQSASTSHGARGGIIQTGFAPKAAGTTATTGGSCSAGPAIVPAKCGNPGEACPSCKEPAHQGTHPPMSAAERREREWAEKLVAGFIKASCRGQADAGFQFAQHAFSVSPGQVAEFQDGPTSEVDLRPNSCCPRANCQSPARSRFDSVQLSGPLCTCDKSRASSNGPSALSSPVVHSFFWVSEPVEPQVSHLLACPADAHWTDHLMHCPPPGFLAYRPSARESGVMAVALRIGEGRPIPVTFRSERAVQSGLVELPGCLVPDEDSMPVNDSSTSESQGGRQVESTRCTSGSSFDMPTLRTAPESCPQSGTNPSNSKPRPMVRPER
jgi:hypothetical protein